MATTKEKWQEIANRGLQDKFDPATRAKFDEAVNRGLISLPQQQLRPEQAATPIDQDFIPTEEALAVPAPGLPERTLGEQIIGAGEAALTLGTGATGGALGFLGGTLEGAAKELTGQIPRGEGLKIAQERASALTFEPRTEVGQEIVGAIGETLGTLPPVIGAPVPSLKGLSGASKVNFAKSTSPLAKKIAEESTGNIQKSFTKKLGNERFTPRIFGMVKEARKQGFDDGMTTVIANASPIDKRRMLQMVNKLEKGKVDELFRVKNRPADIAGDSLLRKIEFVKSNNKQAGQQLGRVAKSLKGEKVDINEPITKFIDDAESLGVTFDENGKPNFEGSQIETIAPAKKLIRDISLRIRRQPDPDALDAHNFKKFIDENVNFGKKAQGLGGKTERIAKDLRKGVNNTLGGQFSKYKEANNRFSETIQALDSLQDAAGRKIDFFGPNADKATGTVLRGLMNNTKGRANLMNAIDNIEATAKKFGGSFDDDILTQMLFADELDAVFGTGARTSLRGEVRKAGIDAAVDISQMTLPGAVATGVKAGAKRLRGINEKNQLKAIKNLLRSK